MTDLSEKLQKWNDVSDMKLGTDMSVLQQDTRTKAVYNDSRDTVFIDIEALSKVDSFYTTMNDLSLDEHAGRLSHNSESSATKFLFPLTENKLKQVGISSKKEIREHLLNNGGIWDDELSISCGGAFFSSFLINIDATFKNVPPLAAVKWLHHIAVGTVFSPQENFGTLAAKRETNIDTIISSPFYLFLERVAHKYTDKRIERFLKEHTLRELFEQKYIGYEGKRNQFLDYIYMVWSQAKSLYTIVNLCNSNRMICHFPWSFKIKTLQHFPLEMLNAQHPLNYEIEKYLESPEGSALPKGDKSALRKLYRFSFQSMAEIPHDFFLNIFENIRNSTEYNTSTGLKYKTFAKVFETLNVDFPKEKISVNTLKVLTNNNTSRGNPDIVWAKGKIDERIRIIISDWLYLSTNAAISDRINIFLDYLISINENGASVNELSSLRPTLFFDTLEVETLPTFHTYLQSIQKSPVSQRSTWGTILQCLTWCFNKLSMELKHHIQCPMPVVKDIFPMRNDNPKQTSRRAMPSNFYEVLLEVATENDYENSKSTQRISVVNNETGETEIVEFKNIARIIHLLLLVPLRSHQVRWLDEGLLDMMLFDYEQLKYVPNPYKHLKNFRYKDGKSHHEKFGATGVLRASNDNDIESILLFINTNKTTLASARKNGTHGYELNWPAQTGIPNVDKVYEIIQEQMKFNRVYAASPMFTTPVSSVDEDAKKYNISEWDHLPKHVPLFRDIRFSKVSKKVKVDKNSDTENLYLPPSSDAVRKVFYNLLDIADKRYKEYYPEYKNRNVAYDSNGNRIFDVHTLRVYGITSLLEQGLSVDTVQALVGHATSVMTIYYKKLLSEEYRRQLFVAKSQNGMANLNTKRFLDKEGNDLIAIFDVANDFEDIDEVHHPKNFHHGMPIILNGGVCFGFNCDEGRVSIKITKHGESQVIEANEYQRCGLCRFFKSGPEFLLEQIYYYNLVGSKISEFIDKRARLIQQSKERYNSKDSECAQIASHQINFRIDDTNLELAKLIQERERREHLLNASLEKAQIKNSLKNLLPSLCDSTEVRVEDTKNLILDNDLEKHMEIATQGMILGIDGDEETIPMRELQKLYNKLADITKSPNALLYVPDDDVKRAAILYKIQQVTEIIGRTFTNEEYENPQLLLDKLQLDTSERIGLALSEFDKNSIISIGEK
ncbi:hypothetical protein D5R81_11895 [Parashewanella spongiae]|uniref:Uncharacterized protein n=1 Tax=Parashewanella spongiae TaxID=342950 RepID=A0A3A6TX78_9GAMM|nr:VPA1269 family protein [Parashewanella spongiae]MCL1078607.1 tyrosine-type recombinase/integrase [Parashewanella spongiae]RJY13009.1 hypothetical protein D5R81_11895 [Parashewanella spongiae]